MRRLHDSVKRLEELEGIDRARQVSAEQALQMRIILEDAEMAEAAAQIADAIREHGIESPECLAAAEAADPIFEQGMERYKQKQAEKEAKRRASPNWTA